MSRPTTQPLDPQIAALRLTAEDCWHAHFAIAQYLEECGKKSPIRSSLEHASEALVELEQRLRAMGSHDKLPTLIDDPAAVARASQAVADYFPLGASVGGPYARDSAIQILRAAENIT